jgi:uncharacterized membrane protein YfcA
MLFETLLPFMVIIAIATYVQTVAGFALGMIVMGTVTTFELVPIAFTSVVISAVTLINGVFILKGGFKTLNLRLVVITVIGTLPGLLIGLALLEYLSASFNEVLQTILGIAIIVAGVSMILKPTPAEQKTTKEGAFFCAGVASGLLSGLFSMGGPPLVYLFYRQPFELSAIRMYLLSIFLVSSISRITMVGIQGGLTLDMLLFSACCIPVVLTMSWVGKHYPPPLSLTNMRRIAFALLIIIGISLLIV